MDAAARIEAERGPDGRTRFVVLHSEPPLLVRRTGASEVHLVGGAAGPLGGDRLRLDISVGPGAHLTVRTVAASVVLPGPTGDKSTVEVRAAVQGTLEWLPEPVIAASGCRHEQLSTVDVAEGGRLTWREELACGRYGEAPGTVATALSVSYGGRILLRQEFTIGAPGWAGPAVLGGARVAGTLLLVDPLWTVDCLWGEREGGRSPSRRDDSDRFRGEREGGRSPSRRDDSDRFRGEREGGRSPSRKDDSEPPLEAEPLGPTAARMPLAGPGVLVTALGPDLPSVRQYLERDKACHHPATGR